MTFSDVERERMEFDVVVVGAGPSGLSAAIRLKQIDPDLSVVVLEKGGEIGAHVLSGAVIDPLGLDRLLPGWRDEEGGPLGTTVAADRFVFLGKKTAFTLPGFLMPPFMNNHGNYVGSLGMVCRWLADKAEALGVEIYAGFAAVDLVYDEKGAVAGVLTGDMGVHRDGTRGPGYSAGIHLMAKYVLIGEGTRGSLAKSLITRFDLDRDREPQKFGLGIKELWEIRPENHRPGLVQHTIGWPLDMSTGGGSFLYHLDDCQVAVGFVVHLNYKNPHLSPFGEFQRFKTHPAIAPVFAGGKRIEYGARAISEGGLQSIPKMSFPGGLLLGCAAGLVNVPRIKGSHNAVLSGMLAADEVSTAIAEGRVNDDLMDFEPRLRRSAIGADMALVRNVKPLWSRFGTGLGLMLGGIDMWFNYLLKFSPFGTLKHGGTDAEALEPADLHKSIAYPKPDGSLTFDLMSSVFLTNTNHDEDQPVHLKVADMKLQEKSELGVYGGPSARYCPAGVYEWVTPAVGETEKARLVINAQNCIHCKTCDIKDPNQNINWVPPQGGEGPTYTRM